MKTIFKISYRSKITGREVFSAVPYSTESSAQKVADRLSAEAARVGRPVVHSVVQFFVTNPSPVIEGKPV